MRALALIALVLLTAACGDRATAQKAPPAPPAVPVMVAEAVQRTVPLQVNAFGSVVTPFFTASPVRDYRSALRANTTAYATFFRSMIARGIYPPPSQFEAWFVSLAHDDATIDRTLEAAAESLEEALR